MSDNATPAPADPATPPQPYDPNDREQLAHAWRLVMWAGFLGSCFMVCVAGAPRTGFLKALGFGPQEFGLLAGLSSAAMVVQFFSGILATRLTRFRKTWTWLLTIARLLIFGLLLAPLLTANLPAPLRVMYIAGIVLISDMLTHCSTPLWTAWMSELVPQDQINRRWAIRQRMTMIGNMSAMVCVALAFHWFEKHGMVINGYIIIATIGIVLGIIDIIINQWVPNPEKPAQKTVGETFGGVLRQAVTNLMQPMRDSRFRPFLRYMALYMLAQAFASPFYAIFALSELGLSIMELQLLNALGTVAIIIFARQLGFLCDKLGLRPVLTLCTFLKFTTPVLFLLAPSGHHVLACVFVGILMFTDGVLSSAWNLSTGGYILKYTPRENRAMYFAAANILSWGLVMGLVPIFSGAMIEHLQKVISYDVGLYSLSGYHVAFVISIILTLSTAGIAASVRDPGAVKLRELWRRIVDINTWRAMRAVTTLHENKDLAARIAAAQQLGDLRSPLGARELLQTCSDPDEQMRDVALRALEQIGSRVEITQELLGRALTTTESRESRMYNLELLGRVGDGTALVPLINLWTELPKTDREMRNKLASTLARLSGDETQSVIDILDKSSE